MTPDISRIEQEIDQLLSLEGKAGYRIAELLAEAQDAKLWRGAANREGEGYRSFEHWMSSLSQDMVERGYHASVSDFKRKLSHFRLYVQALGFSVDDLRLIGATNLDEVRKVIDWDDRARTIHEPGRGGKWGYTEARAFLKNLLEEAAENEGRTFTLATKELVEDALGRQPRRLELVLYELAEGRYRIKDIVVWQGGTAERPLESMAEETMKWLTTKYSAKATMWK